jgi:hypothetical protein
MVYLPLRSSDFASPPQAWGATFRTATVRERMGCKPPGKASWKRLAEGPEARKRLRTRASQDSWILGFLDSRILESPPAQPADPLDYTNKGSGVIE